MTLFGGPIQHLGAGVRQPARTRSQTPARTPVLFVVVAAVLVAGPSGAAPWTLNRGDLYAYTGGFWTRSRHFFDAGGDRQRFLRDGTSRVAGVSLQGAYGLTDRLLVLAAVPFLWYELEDDLVRDAGRSPGDLRLDLRWQPVAGAVDAGLQGGVKFPTATTRDPTRAQVGEGQYDLEVLVSAGRRLPRAGLWASVDAGYRWRRRNGDTGFKPGDEFLYRLELGSEITRRLALTARFGGFDGGPGEARVFGFDVPAVTARRTASLNPDLSYRLDRRWQLVLSANLPVSGQRSYAGRQLAVGVAYNRSPRARLEGAGSFSNPRGSSCCQIQ